MAGGTDNEWVRPTVPLDGLTMNLHLQGDQVRISFYASSRYRKASLWSKIIELPVELDEDHAHLVTGQMIGTLIAALVRDRPGTLPAADFVLSGGLNGHQQMSLF